MDKYEYKVRLEEINKLIDCENYMEAASLADTIDWRRVKSISTLLKIAALYRVNRRNDDARAVMIIAYDKYPTNRSVLYSLCEISIETDDIVAAIEYYKQFVRIAPRDTGVFTLRYRILEAQEASLEERIQLLEELKKRYYQEEWGYELAYLYHRVGLITQCVEECNQMVLWFSDGPYVKKALELKMLHESLTPEQQRIYDEEIMKAESGAVGDYDYNDQQDYYGDEAGYYSNEEVNYSDNSQGYENQGYDNQEYYSEGDYANSGYTDQEYYNEDSYNNQGYYGKDGYENSGYTNQEYYSEDGYTDQEYYSEEGYTDQEYYSEEGYTDQEYYNEDSYNNQGYYGKDGYENSGYTNQEYYSEDGYANNGYIDQEYETQEYYADEQPVENVEQEDVKNIKVSSDMSQYNTINLQKVVAESMKELFADEKKFAEERAQFIAEEQRYSDSLTNDENDEAATRVVKTSAKVTDMIAGVSKEEPKPQDGAIKTVFVPGNDARVIKEENDISQLRDTTEITVNEEQLLMEEREENVYKEPVYEAPVLNTENEADYDEEVAEELAVVEEVENEEYTDEEYYSEEEAENEEYTDEEYYSEEEEQNEEYTDEEYYSEEEEQNEEYTNEEYYSEEEEQNEEYTNEEYYSEEVQNQEYYADEITYGERTSELENMGGALSEWERIKQENAKRHEAELRQRVLSQTGQILANFDTSVQQSEILGGLEVDDDIENIDLSKEDEQKQIKDDFLNAEETAEMPVEEVQNLEATENENNSDEEYSEIEMAVRAEMGGDTVDIPHEQINSVLESEINELDEVEELTEIHETDESQEYYSDEEYQYDDEAEYSEGYNEEYSEEYQNYEYSDEITGSDIDEYEAPNDGMLNTKEIVMNTADISMLQEKIIETTDKEAKGALREEIREFTEKEHNLFDNFAVTKRIKKQTIFAIDNMTLASYTGNVVITGEPGMDTVLMAKNLIRAYQQIDDNFSGKVAKTTGKKLNNREIRETLESLNNGALIIEKANGIKEEKLYELAVTLNQENLGIIIIIEDTKKEITKLFHKQAMISDYFNLRIDLVEMDTNSLVEYAKNYAFTNEYSIDELGILALYSRISNMQSGNHVVTKAEVKEIIDEAIWRSKRNKVRSFVDILFSKRYDSEDMIILKERDFM